MCTIAGSILYSCFVDLVLLEKSLLFRPRMDWVMFFTKLTKTGSIVSCKVLRLSVLYCQVHFQKLFVMLLPVCASDH